MKTYWSAHFNSWDYDMDDYTDIFFYDTNEEAEARASDLQKEESGIIQGEWATVPVIHISRGEEKEAEETWETLLTSQT